LKKFGVNAYEIELPDGIEISLIFNISDLYPYKAEEARTGDEQLSDSVDKADASCRKSADGVHTGQKSEQEDQVKAIL
jgi:hypothetical protein